MSSKRPAKLRPDVAEVAYRVFQEAVSEKPKTPAPSERTEKHPEAVRRGSLGGKKGGPARARSMNKTKRSKIARKGAAALWKKKRDS